jgi:single-stranded-DNA-specific exonuclease
MRWTFSPLPADEVEALGRALDVSPVLAELLLRRELGETTLAARFLRPALAELTDPFLVPHLEAAAGRLRDAIEHREDIVVLGDYDVDGVSSTALLVSVLRRFGLNPRYIVPRRMEDGYGLTRSAIDRALEEGLPRLFVALDCGTNSHEEIAYLEERGVDVIVVDHHRAREEEPVARGILVNPHVHTCDGDEPWRNLCTVGLVFKLAHGLLKRLRAENHPVAFRVKLRDYLDLAALGTVADLVPLREENRLMARFGLRILEGAARPGLRALMEVAGVRPEQGLNPVDVSFRLGPRINASGRLADAALSVDLILSEDEAFCQATAQQLDVFNRERQDIERQITEEAEAWIEREFADWPGIVLYHENWHPGVVGIVAGRVSRKYNRPCIVLGSEGTLAKGSGRSIEGVNLVEVLGRCAEYLENWGGHPMAVGVALDPAQIEAFRPVFRAAVQACVGREIEAPELPIAAWITPDQIGSRLMADLEVLHPFGQGNPEPVFALRGVVLDRPPDVFRDQHFRFQFEDSRGRRLFGVAWKMAHRLPPVGEPLDLAVEAKWNFYNDRRLLQLQLVDWRPTAS